MIQYAYLIVLPWFTHRWDLSKFSRVSSRIGSSMKSVGEVMAIGSFCIFKLRKETFEHYYFFLKD